MGVLGEARYGLSRYGQLELQKFTTIMPYEVQLRDLNGNLVAIFENALSVGYQFQINVPATMRFELPADDPKRALFDEGGEIWLFEDGVLVEVFRLSNRSLSKAVSIPLERAFLYAVSEASSPAIFSRVRLPRFSDYDSTTLATGETQASCLDVTGETAYIGFDLEPGKVVKIDLRTFKRIGALDFETGENKIKCMTISQGYLFAGLDLDPGQIVKVDLLSFERHSSKVFTGIAGSNVHAIVSDLTHVYAVRGNYLSKLNISDLVEQDSVNIGAATYAAVIVAGHIYVCTSAGTIKVYDSNLSLVMSGPASLASVSCMDAGY